MVAMIQTHLLAALIAAAIAAVAVWIAQDWRYDAQLSRLRAQHADTLRTIADKTATAAQAVRRAEQATAARLAAADAKYHQELSNARQETDRLRACVRAGTCGVRIITAAPSAAACAGPANAAASSVGDGAVTLDADAAQRVLDLRESVATDSAKLSYLQDYARVCHAATTQPVTDAP